MAYERNTTEGIRSWLQAELSTSGWNSSSIVKGITEDAMNTIVDNFDQFNAKIKQAIVLTTLYMRKGDLSLYGDGLNKIIQIAVNDKNDFVKTTAHVLVDYPNSQSLDLKIDAWSSDFKSLLNNVGNSITENGFNFHPMEDLILQPCARTTPPYVSANYTNYKATASEHFTLTDNRKDIISSEARFARFGELVESEERNEQAEAQQAQAVAQKRAGAELHNKAKRVASPTSSNPNPFPFPPANNAQPNMRPGGPIRTLSSGSVPAAATNALFNKRPARPAPTGLFINKARAQPRTLGGNIQKPSAVSHVPRGLQRNQKTQMLDFDAASEFEQSSANAKKQAQDEIKAKQEAKKQEALEKKQRAAAEKERVLADKRARAEERARRREREAAERREAMVKKEQDPQSPTPTSPTTPTSTLPHGHIKSEHVFAVPALPAHLQQQQQNGGPSDPAKDASGKLTTF